MALPAYTSPTLSKEAFNCPVCGAFAKQDWIPLHWNVGRGGFSQIQNMTSAHCHHCKEISFWIGNKMIFPAGGTAPLPNPDLPDEIQQDFQEARSIVTQSPRGAAALLRLAIQKLCKHLGEKGENPNDDIANLVRKGLPARVQQALDAVRVIGNEAVHPGTIDLQDNPEMAAALFGLVNFIAEKMLTEPKHIETLYASMPASKREAIEKRDK